MMFLASFFLGIGLAASAGFRVFLPLLVMSVFAYLGILPLDETWMWVGSIPAIVALSLATFVETMAYYIPWVDNLLDSISIPLAGIAGTMLMAATLTDLSPMLTWGLAIVAGGGAASTISASSATTRMASSVATAGVGNPIVSTVETGASLLISIVSILIPFLGFLMVLMVLLFIYKAFKTFKRKVKKEPANVKI